MKNKNKVFIFVTAGKWQVNGIKNAINQGYDVLSIDENPRAEGFKLSKYKINIKLSQKEKIFKVLEKLDLNYVAVISYCSEAGMILSSEISKRYKLYAPSINTAKILTNKHKQRSLFSKISVAQPKFKVFKNKKILFDFLNNNKKNLIIKPVDSSGSRGIFRFNKNTKNLKEKINNTFKYTKSNEVIVEKFIFGLELTVETFFQNGEMTIIAITSKKKLNSTKGTVAYELSTYNLSKENQTKLKNIIYRCYSNAGFFNGVGHAEVIKCKNQFYIVEIAGRGPGFDVFDRFLPMISGINIPYLLIKNATGKYNKFKFDIKKNKQGVISYFPSKKGKIFKIKRPDTINKNKEVYFKKIVKIGDITNSANSDGDRLGYIITIDKYKKNALKKIKFFKNKITFEYKNEHY